MLSVVMLNVITLSVVAPRHDNIIIGTSTKSTVLQAKLFTANYLIFPIIKSLQ
jgi:hypothetical protein